MTDPDTPSLISLKDVAREAGVSVATVDRVLHGRPGVRKGTVTRVEETIARLAYVEIEPRDGPVADYGVELRSVSIMQCDYEGPHIELLDWKRGLSEPLRLPRQGNRFLLPPGALDETLPPFPAFQHDELRRAIARHWGETGLAPEEQAAPCAPFLGARLLTVRRHGDIVHEVLLSYPGGC